MYQKHAAVGVVLNRTITAAALLLSFVFMAQMVQNNTVRMAILAIWTAGCAFATVKSLGDAISGTRHQQRTFEQMLARWQDVMNGRGMALAVFYTIVIASNVIKLVVPLVTRFA